MDANLDRDVIRCRTCGLMQYRTRTGYCRRCLRLLPPKLNFLARVPKQQDVPGDDRPLFEKRPNRETVERLGQRIQELRESCGMTQSQLQQHSGVSRSFLSRVESGRTTPSLGTLEKISEALGVGLNRFLAPASNGEGLLDDPFIKELRPFLRQLDWDQWQSIMVRLAEISEHVSTERENAGPLAPPPRGPISEMSRGQMHPAAMGSRQSFTLRG